MNAEPFSELYVTRSSLPEKSTTSFPTGKISRSAQCAGGKVFDHRGSDRPKLHFINVNRAPFIAFLPKPSRSDLFPLNSQTYFFSPEIARI